MERKNDDLEFDFQIAIGTGFAGMDVTEFAISKAKKHAVSQKGCLKRVSRDKREHPQLLQQTFTRIPALSRP